MKTLKFQRDSVEPEEADYPAYVSRAFSSSILYARDRLRERRELFEAVWDILYAAIQVQQDNGANVIVIVGVIVVIVVVL